MLLPLQEHATDSQQHKQQNSSWNNNNHSNINDNRNNESQQQLSIFKRFPNDVGSVALEFLFGFFVGVKQVAFGLV